MPRCKRKNNPKYKRNKLFIFSSYLLTALFCLPKSSGAIVVDPYLSTQPLLNVSSVTEQEVVIGVLKNFPNQSTMLELLFNSTNVGSLLSGITGVTILSPDDNAWRILFNDTSTELSSLLGGASGNIILENLLKYHILKSYNLYSDFQLAPRGASFQSLIDTPVYAFQRNGQNLFSSQREFQTVNASNIYPDIYQDQALSIQGINYVLVPNLDELKPSDPPVGSPVASTSSSSIQPLPIAIPETRATNQSSSPPPEAISLTSEGVRLSWDYLAFKLALILLLFVIQF